MTIPRLRLKGGVDGRDVDPRLWLALYVAAGIWRELGAEELVVTALRDGHHRPGSLHYVGRAADLRTRNLPSEWAKHEAARRLEAALDPAFDVVLELTTGTAEHVHLELDPKPGES